MDYNKEYADWIRNNYEPSLKTKSEDDARKYSLSHKPVEPLYVPDSISEDYINAIGFPGSYPFTRGAYSSMYRGKPWTIRQYAGYGTAKQANERYKFLLQQGTKGLSVAFDLPTQTGHDSSDEIAKGEIGRVGVAIDTVEDMKQLFHEIPLNKTSTSMTINSTACIILPMYVAVAEEANIDIKELRGTVQNDVLKEFLARGTQIFPTEASAKLSVDLIEWCNKTIPKFNPISISGYHIREAGATAIEELAFTFANAITYLDLVLERGFKVDDVAPRLSFFFCACSDIFEEIAKFRAARRIWARILKERYNAQKPESMRLRFHAQTSGYSLTAQQPFNNIMRVAYQAFAAIAGGAQSLHTNGLDEALSLPSEQAATTALRTQQVLAHETGLTNTIDPLGGSYCVERMTDDIEIEVKDLIQQIDAKGGMVKAINSGYVSKMIEESANLEQEKVEQKEKIIVGVNQFQENETTQVPPFENKLDQSKQNEKIDSLNKLKTKRNNALVKNCLEGISTAARNNDNVISTIYEAVKARATLGEITRELKTIYGSWQ